MWALIVLAATIFPFDPTWRGGSRTLFETKGFRDTLDIILNIVLFVPLGLLLAQRFNRPALGWVRIGVVAGTSAFVFSLSIEALQLFSPLRTSSLIDVFTNTFGAVSGGVAYRAWGDAAAARISWFHRNHSMAILVLAGISAITLLASAALQYGTRLSNWNENYFLLLGNEHTGDRPWHGRVLRFQLSDRSIPFESVRSFAAGGSPGLPTGNLAAFNFATGQAEECATCEPLRFDWVGATEGAIGQGVELTKDRWMQSAQPPANIARRIKASNAFTLRLTCASNSNAQSGPARIVSYSINPLQQNFILGQEGSDLVFRLRTPITGPVGARLAIALPQVFSDTKLVNILVSYGGSELHAAVQGSNLVYSLDLNPGASLASFYRLPPPEHFAYLKVEYYAAVFAVPLGLLGLLARNTRIYLGAGAAWLASFGCALEGVLSLASPRPFDYSNLGMCVAIGFAVLVAVGLVRTAPAS